MMNTVAIVSLAAIVATNTYVSAATTLMSSRVIANSPLLILLIVSSMYVCAINV